MGLFLFGFWVNLWILTDSREWSKEFWNEEYFERLVHLTSAAQIWSLKNMWGWGNHRRLLGVCVCEREREEERAREREGERNDNRKMFASSLVLSPIFSRFQIKATFQVNETQFN